MTVGRGRAADRQAWLPTGAGHGSGTGSCSGMALRILLLSAPRAQWRSAGSADSSGGESVGEIVAAQGPAGTVSVVVAEPCSEPEGWEGSHFEVSEGRHGT
jgi:hypothetical protein